ncbi:MAG: diguanylate cyclase [Methylomonas sp.]|nr:diguanylate cyclase [Methylomonas sp.]PPD22355.1 MAG: hypothetical protein CTY23_02000 [Methylomonas sp.]PPD26858.1 MAG: hypothetical protein CTY22_03735 [Methylomonas sp.]PPD38765.1 MAG: hypothetical protein CTY21_03735 [Methylomonas sp.]PPD40191.1 MAG: hypothetical protein CTY17_07030 [Methylomonas sp.]
MPSNPSVLIVESSRVFRNLLSELMASQGFATVCCDNGKQALAACKTESFELVCIAYHLPDMSGEVLCHYMRGMPTLKNVRIILFTAEDNEDTLRAALLAGATDIYNKSEFASFQIYIARFAEQCKQTMAAKVMLVEDTQSQRLWLQSLLSAQGYYVDSFSDGESALQALSNNDYDGIITDVVLAGKMSGLNLIRAIRRLPGAQSTTPIFVMTAYDDASRRMELLNIGANDYLAKPVNPEELLFRVANLIKADRSIKQLNSEREVLKEIALIDPVTQLYNRNAFNRLLPKALDNARRSQMPVSLAIIDIDHFKKINDEHGHIQGDRVLAELGLWLRDYFRQGDYVFRWGGEEFVVYLHQCDVHHAFNVIEKALSHLKQRRLAGLALTVSVGMSGYPGHELPSLEALFEKADNALYAAKTGGRDRIVVFSDTCGET